MMTMKKTINIMAMALLSILMMACADDNQEARTPVASVAVNATELEINQTMKVNFNGVADQVVIYTGDKDHEYGLRDSSNTGYVVNKGEFTYSYSRPGKFHVVCIATTYDTYMAEGLRQDSTSFDVTVIDDVATITGISSYANPNTYFAEALDDANWLMCLPAKQLYNNKEIAVKANRQRLTLEVGSESAKIYIDDALYSNRTYYDLTTSHKLKVVSNYGTERNYNLYTLVYPELKSVKIAGATGKLKRNAFYQDLLTYEFNLPEGTDPKAANIEFTLDEGIKAYANGEELTSGSTIDLTDSSKSYTLVRTSADNAKVQATSKLNFSFASR